MRCWFCNSKKELVWVADSSYEDYCLDGEGIVAVLQCTNEECNAVFEGYLDIKDI